MAFLDAKYDYFLGYALSGGGAKGFAHLGALMVLEKCGLKPEVIAGTSAGSLAGVFYADGFHPEEIAEIFKKTEFHNFVELALPRSGFLKTNRLHQFLKNNLRSKRFEELQIPLCVVATDWQKARTVVFSEGDELVDAIVASCSMPVIFQPHEIDAIPYVDGGLLKNFPVSIIRSSCRYLIGVNVALIIPPAEKDNIRSMTERTYNIMSNSNTLLDKTLCDILIETKGINKYPIFNLRNMEAIMQAGYHYAAIAMNREESWKIIEKCHRHYKRQEKIYRQIQYIRDKKGELLSGKRSEE